MTPHPRQPKNKVRDRRKGGISAADHKQSVVQISIGNSENSSIAQNKKHIYNFLYLSGAQQHCVRRQLCSLIQPLEKVHEPEKLRMTCSTIVFEYLATGAVDSHLIKE